jgi:hypothetical protein
MSTDRLKEFAQTDSETTTRSRTDRCEIEGDTHVKV